MNKADLEKIYDKYCPILYGIAIQICPLEADAEKILICTFKIIQQKNITNEKYPNYCITLMRLILKIANELYPQANNYKLKQFENTPLLNQLICSHISLQDYCTEKKMTKQEVLRIICKEFTRIKNFKKENMAPIKNEVYSNNMHI